MKEYTLTHKMEAKNGSPSISLKVKSSSTTKSPTIYNQNNKITTYFDGDERFRFLHSEADSMSDVKSFFYDYVAEDLFLGDIYLFISLCLRTASENGGTLMFKDKAVKVLSKRTFSGVGIDELEMVEVNYVGDVYLITELIDYEI